jgi:hypothetical protein
MQGNACISEPRLSQAIYLVSKDYLLSYVKKGGTIFFCTHILEVAQEICTMVSLEVAGYADRQTNAVPPRAYESAAARSTQIPGTIIASRCIIKFRD